MGPVSREEGRGPHLHERTPTGAFYVFLSSAACKKDPKQTTLLSLFVVRSDLLVCHFVYVRVRTLWCLFVIVRC